MIPALFCLILPCSLQDICLDRISRPGVRSEEQWVRNREAVWLICCSLPLCLSLRPDNGM